ncbi:MAG: hypothetical protein ABFD04_13095 [Syntrophomonas sp.]
MNSSANNAIRRPKASITPFNTNSLHLRNPWTLACWSLLYPGFGHINNGSISKGFLLFTGELLINYKSHLNLAILYSFNGAFQAAKQVLDTQWLIIYCSVLLFAIWDSYRLTVECNKLSVLADREHSPITPTAVSGISVNSLDKRNPWVGFAWSMLLPGLGHMYAGLNVLSTIIFIFGTGIFVVSHSLQAIMYTIWGDFSGARNILDWQWFMNLPSLYGFAAWDAYLKTVELNKLFNIEQARYFKKTYQGISLRLPFPVRGG